jgi:hypothetical protein
MTIAFLFWLLMILWLVFGVWSTWPNLRAGGPDLLLFILLGLLGWKVFGAAIHP